MALGDHDQWIEGGKISLMNQHGFQNLRPAISLLGMASNDIDDLLGKPYLIGQDGTGYWMSGTFPGMTLSIITMGILLELHELAHIME